MTGSHATLGSYPKVCTACGRPVRIGGPEPLWFETDAAGVERSWHAACRARTGDERCRRLEQALIRCAELAGEGSEAIEAARRGALTHPPLEQWAVQAVARLRSDYLEGRAA